MSGIREIPQEPRTAEDVLRDLAMYLGVGGYNDIGDAPFDPEKFDRKIRWGIDYFVKETVFRCADKIEELSKRPSTRWGEVKAAIQAIATEPEASPAVGDVRALPYLVHLARQRWDGNWSYTLEELAERWLAGQFHNDAAESDAKAALREGGSR